MFFGTETSIWPCKIEIGIVEQIKRRGEVKEVNVLTLLEGK